MFEKVNPDHPDKVADRIAGAIVDLAYDLSYDNDKNPKIAVEVLIGHGVCHIIAETSVDGITDEAVEDIVYRIAGQKMLVFFDYHPQDVHLAENQKNKIRCGDNGIFCGMPTTDEQKLGRKLAEDIYRKYRSDGKYIVDTQTGRIIICQSKAGDELKKEYPLAQVNPLGYWEGGTDTDTGATNRKLGSDMGDAVTGGGLHGKDLSKADVSVNIYAHLKAQETGKPVRLFCAIGDETVDGKPYEEIVEVARNYIVKIGGFEKFAEWGLI